MTACSRCGAPADADYIALSALLTRKPDPLCTACVRLSANTKPDPPRTVYKPLASVPFGRQPGDDDDA